MRFSGFFFLHFSGGMSCKAEGAGARVGHGTYVEIENALYLFWSFLKCGRPLIGSAPW